MRTAVERFRLPIGDGFIWIATEVPIARALYSYVVETLYHPKQWGEAGGYWSQRQADGDERIVWFPARKTRNAAMAARRPRRGDAYKFLGIGKSSQTLFGSSNRT